MLVLFRCVSISITAKFTDSQTNSQTHKQTHIHLAPFSLVLLCAPAYDFVQHRMVRIVTRMVKIITRMVRIVNRMVWIVK